VRRIELDHPRRGAFGHHEDAPRRQGRRGAAAEREIDKVDHVAKNETAGSQRRSACEDNVANNAAAADDLDAAAFDDIVGGAAEHALASAAADCGGAVGSTGQDRFDPAEADRCRAGEPASFNELQPRNGAARFHQGVDCKAAGEHVLLAAADVHSAGGAARTDTLYARIVEDRIDREPAAQNVLDTAIVDGAIEIHPGDVLGAATLDECAAGRAAGSDLLNASRPDDGAIGRAVGIDDLRATADGDVAAAVARGYSHRARHC
jgi:hypothetical protein